MTVLQQDHRAADTGTLRSLRSGFMHWAAATPEAPALVVRDRTLSYGALDCTARVWASALVRAAGGPAQRIGIFGSRSEVAYTSVLAALYSGAAFVPLNPTFPPARTRAMIERAELDAIIVDKGAAKQLAEVLDGLPTVPPLITPELTAAEVKTPHTLIDRDALAAHAMLEDLPVVRADRIAYLLFTSGSTGVPKGVPVTHGNVMHFMDYVSRRYDVVPGDRLSQTFDQTFDLSVFDLFVAWENGACVCSMQPLDLLAPARFAERQRLTIWFSVPSLAALMRKKGSLKPGIFPSLRLSLFCGEPLPRASAEMWQAAAPASVVENIYGPTELTIACFTHKWNPETSPGQCVNDVVPIGVPFDGLTEVVLDDDRKPVPDGESGELCVAGPQTVPGYWNNPEKTQEQFITVSVDGQGPLRFYRTGDRVQRLANGEYVYLGRVDHQVKILGHRVELAEIEAVLGRHAGVTQAVAMGWPVVNGSAEGIVAFITGTDVEVARLIAAARTALPDYMTPRATYVLDALPLNGNGKVDRPLLMKGLAAGQYAASA
jgi:amino acid adenylation domain-containing protein